MAYEAADRRIVWTHAGRHENRGSNPEVWPTAGRTVAVFEPGQGIDVVSVDTGDVLLSLKGAGNPLPGLGPDWVALRDPSGKALLGHVPTRTTVPTPDGLSRVVRAAASGARLLVLGATADESATMLCCLDGRRELWRTVAADRPPAERDHFLVPLLPEGLLLVRSAPPFNGEGWLALVEAETGRRRLLLDFAHPHVEPGTGWPVVTVQGAYLALSAADRTTVYRLPEGR